jgi:hypothetical protein
MGDFDVIYVTQDRDCCEGSNKTLGSVKCGEFLN